MKYICTPRSQHVSARSDDDGLETFQRFETTPGRVKLGALLPLNAKAPFELVNRLLRKKEVQQIIDSVYRYCGQKESVIFCDQIMTTGFREAFKAGISFGKDDMVIPDAKWKIVDTVREQVKEFEQQYMDGLITQGEKYNKVVDAWSKCSDDVANAMMDDIRSMKRDEDGSEMEPNIDLYDVALRCPWLPSSDETAGRYARSDGQTFGRDYRNADHLELQRRPDRARVLQLDPRCP